jgi:hypothetical protein
MGILSSTCAYLVEDLAAEFKVLEFLDESPTNVAIAYSTQDRLTAIARGIRDLNADISKLIIAKYMEPTAKNPVGPPGG